MTTLNVLAKEVELKGIRTLAAFARLCRGPVPEHGDRFDLRSTMRGGFTRDGEKDFSVTMELRCQCRRTREAAPFCRFLFRATAEYSTQSPLVVWSDDLLNQFSQTNALIHLWPYARQYVQSASGQLQLIPITLPPFRVKAIVSTATE